MHRAVFVCYIEDTYLNDGDYVHPYFGEKNFFEDFENALEEIDVDDGNVMSFAVIKLLSSVCSITYALH